LRDLEHRVKSVKNIKKITSSMKMIATTKLNKAQAAIKTAKLYGAANVDLLAGRSRSLCRERKEGPLDRRLVRQGTLRRYPLLRLEAGQKKLVGS